MSEHEHNNGIPQSVNELEETIVTLNNKVQELQANADSRNENLRAEIARMEEQNTNLRNHYNERLETTRERWQADADEKQTRIDEILGTDVGEAWQKIRDTDRNAQRAIESAQRWQGLAEQAESEKRKALESVNGGDNIHPEDPRVLHIWEKAHRIATTQGFCQEYDRIAEALGIPELAIDYSGSVTVNFSGSVTIPISGMATRQEIQDGDVTADIDASEVINNIDAYDLDYSIEEIEVDAD